MRLVLIRISLGLSLLPILVAQVSAGTGPREMLKQHVADLQQSPGDDALREKIIKLARQIKPALALPKEAGKHMDRGEAAFELAKNPQEFADAIKEFQSAVNIAPWLASGYFNLATAQEKAGRLTEAIRSLKFYLLADPKAIDASAVESKINKLEYAAEKAALEASPAGIAAREGEKAAAFIASLDGVVWIRQMGSGMYGELRMRNGHIEWRTIYTDPQWAPSKDGVTLTETTAGTFPVIGNAFDCSVNPTVRCRGTIADGASTITMEETMAQSGYTNVFQRRE